MTSINRIATTAKGWTDNITCYEWFTKTFIPQATARREDPEEPIVLVWDGHASHKTPEILRAAIEHNIAFHFLPPHTTHRLQPLDVGIFGPLQRKWQERCDDIISETNMEVPRSRFVKEYMDVRNKVFTPDLIQSAWKKAGMWPMDSEKFTEKDFAPSKLMSYTTSLPPGYPEFTDVPDMLSYTHSEVDERSSDDEDGETGDEMTEGEKDDGKDDWTADEDGTNTVRESAVVGEVSEDVTAGGTDMSCNMGRLSRYKRESHRLEQPIFTYPHRSTPSGIPPVSVNSRENLEEEVRSLRSQLETANSQLETANSQLETANSQLEAALAHSVCAGWEIKSLKERLNSKSNAKKRKVQVNAQYISSAEATRILEEQDREEAEKRQREEEAQAVKKARDDQRKQQREAGSLTFTGSLNSKTKDDLLDITFTLHLTGSDSNTTDTRAALISMINDHLDKNPHLASSPTFTGLFLSRTRGRKRNDENATPTEIPPPPSFPPGLPCQSLSPDFAGDISDPESEPPMVLFSDLPPSGRFFQSINSTPPDFNLPGPSSFATYPHPISHPTSSQFLPPFYYPPPPHG